MHKIIYLLIGLSILAAACRKDKNDNVKAELSVKNFWPNSGNAGTIVNIIGQGFGHTAADNEVLFNGTAAKVVDVRDSMLLVLAPEAGKTGNLAVTVGGKKLELGTYTYQKLSLRQASPLNGPAGTNISIRGEGFSSLKAPAKVTINGKEAIVTGASDTLLVAAVPEGAGTGVIKVMVDGQEVTGPEFVFQRISAIKPMKGGAGTTVTISGEGFSNIVSENTVAFNGKPARLISASAGQLVAEAPEGVGTGPVTVTIHGQKTVGSVFTVVPKPLLKSVWPLSGPAGAEVVINGENFSEFTDEVTVSFNGHSSVLVNVSEKKITVKVPAGSGTGNISVTVNGQQTQGPVFKEQALGIAELMPDNGLEGTEVTIKGMGFSTTATDNIVTFNGVPAIVSSATGAELKVKVPAGVTTGPVQVRTGSLDAIGPVFKRAGVITLAGGPSQNLFNSPAGIAADTKGNVFVSNGNKILKISSSGVVTDFAGSDAAGSMDGNGTDARFLYPGYLAADAQDNIYVCEASSRSIRKITSSGVVSTFAKLGFFPTGLGVDKAGAVYVGVQYGYVVRLDVFGNPTKLSNGYESPTGKIAVDNSGTVFYTADFSYNTVYTITGNVRNVFAGSDFGFRDGPYRTALFGTPTGVVYDATTNSLLTTDNNAVRMLADGNVTTITGWKGGMGGGFGYKDGTLNEALFSGIQDHCVDQEGNIYVLERNNKAVRKIILK